MKFLGIDYGTKRVGIATSDETGKVAFPRVIFKNTASLFDEIIEFVNEEKIDVIVIGASMNLDGLENPVMKEIKNLKDKLERKTKLPIHLEPEFMTSVEARRMNNDVFGVDAAAASIILQSFIDSNE